MKKYTVIFILLLFISAQGQETRINKYGLQVVDDTTAYKLYAEKDSSQMLIDLEDFIPGIVLDIRYAGSDNFYGQPVYSMKKAFLRLPAALALKEIQEELSKENKGLKVFDAYRPYSVTVLFYDKIKDTTFVASAWTGSRHNRGCAVDLTLIDLDTGNELKMPTPYDDFTEKAAADYINITPEEKTNRDLLQDIMKKHGFLTLRSEWWHFDYSDWKQFYLTDISFRDLEKYYFEYKEKKLNGRK